MRGVVGPANGGWRVPAAKLEGIVAAATRTILDDKQLIVSAIEEDTTDSTQVAAFLESAAAFSAQLQVESESISSAATLLDRVELKP